MIAAVAVPVIQAVQGVQAAASSTPGNPVVNVSVFVSFVVVTLGIALRAGRNGRTTAQFYAGGRRFRGWQNGFALSGDYLSAASFLGIAGAIALSGYDGFLYSIGFFVAWLVALLLVAEPLRNTGRFTMADVLSFRLRQRPVRTAAAVSTMSVTFFYLLAQMAGAGALVNLMLGVNGQGAQNVTIAVVGALMIAYVLVGGMAGTTWMQIVKAAFLLTCAALMTLLVLQDHGWSLSHLIGSAVTRAGDPGLLAPATAAGASTTSKIDLISLSLALVLGTAGLPHVLMRFYTVPSAREARRSVVWAIWLIGIFYLLTLVLGFGAMALVGRREILSAPGRANAAAPLLAYHLGGEALLGLVAAVAFATILAVVSGLTITASTSFAHDVYSRVLRKGQVNADDEVRVARITVVVIGVFAIIGGMYAKDQNVAFLVALAFAVAASANLPTILYSLYWKGFTTRGAVWSIYGGLLSALALIAVSPVVLGDSAAFPLANPGIISIPLAFFLGWFGSVTTPRDVDPVKFAEMEVRALTGAGAETPA